MRKPRSDKGKHRARRSKSIVKSIRFKGAAYDIITAIPKGMTVTEFVTQCVLSSKGASVTCVTTVDTNEFMNQIRDMLRDLSLQLSTDQPINRGRIQDNIDNATRIIQDVYGLGAFDDDD